MDPVSFSPEEISETLKLYFAAPLIISTIGLIIYGVNLCQLVEYLSRSAKRDHVLTTIWVCLVVIFTSASLFSEVYFNWSFSILSFARGEALIRSEMSGALVVLYSVVIMLVQLFWLSCIKKSMPSRPKLSWTIIAPLAIISITSFVISIVIGVLARIKPGANWSFPSPLTSILLRVVLGFDLGVDLLVLIALVTQLTLMKRNTIHHKTTISKLSWILIGTTTVSSLIMIAEIVIDYPQPADGSGFINFNITFAPMIPTIYCLGMLSVLNARSNLWPLKWRTSSQTSGGGNRLIPGLYFTVDLPDPKTESESRAASVESSA